VVDGQVSEAVEDLGVDPCHLSLAAGTVEHCLERAGDAEIAVVVHSLRCKRAVDVVPPVQEAQVIEQLAR
jgi:hypothetical protein